MELALGDKMPLFKQSKSVKHVGKLFRSNVYWSKFQQKREKVRMPKVATYINQIQHCQEMYERLHLDTHEDEGGDHISPFPLLRGHTIVSQVRPLTYTMRKSDTSIRPYSIRSAPAFMFQNDRNFEKDDANIANDGAKSESTDYDCDEYGHGRKRTRMDPERLCEHLKERGLGLPLLVKSNSTYRSVGQIPPRGMCSRSLTRNPSRREQIKGRARLDQEMANMRALAFCEQQTPTMFRTASANMKNRDVQFMEDDFRIQMQRDDFDVFIDHFDDDDDIASIVKMSVKPEELFKRINTWVEDVENSCKVYNTVSDVSVNGDHSSNLPVTNIAKCTIE